jgi:putative membrane protein
MEKSPFMKSMRIVWKWLLSVAAFLFVAEFVPGIEITGFETAFLAAFFWWLLGVTLRPFLLILTLPITVLTLGFFSLIINALLLWFMGGFLKGFVVDGFLAAFFGAITLSIIQGLLHWAFTSRSAIR